MGQFKIRTRYQREQFAMTLAGEVKKSTDAKMAALGECIVYVLAAPMERVDGAVAKLLREHPDLAASLNLYLKP